MPSGRPVHTGLLRSHNAGGKLPLSMAIQQFRFGVVGQWHEHVAGHSCRGPSSSETSAEGRPAARLVGRRALASSRKPSRARPARGPPARTASGGRRWRAPVEASSPNCPCASSWSSCSTSSWQAEAVGAVPAELAAAAAPEVVAGLRVDRRSSAGSHRWFTRFEQEEPGSMPVCAGCQSCWPVGHRHLPARDHAKGWHIDLACRTPPGRSRSSTAAVAAVPPRAQYSDRGPVRGRLAPRSRVR